MITYAYENLFKLDSQKKDIVITDGTVTNSGTSVVITGDTVRFTNSDLHFEDLSLLESLCTESVLHFGACESSEFKFTISSKVASLEGKVLHVWLYFNDDASTLFEVGTYKVASDIATASKTVRNITAYDLMFDVLNTDYTAWYNALSDSINTVKKFRDAFFTHVGITQKSVTLVNDSMPVSIGEATAMTGAIILRAICEINGRFGHMTRNNLFDYVKLVQNIQGLYPAVDLYPSPTLYPRKPKSVPIGSSGNYVPPLRYESYEVPSITRLQIRRDQSDIGVVVGTSGTDYIVQGNFLTYGLNGTQMTTAATNLLGEITGVVFQPFSFSMRTNLCLEVGDAIRCNDNLTGVEGYMLYRCVTGIQAMFDEIRCSSEKDYSQNVNSVGYQFQALNGKTLVLKQDIDGVSTELTEQLALDGIVRQGTYAEQTNTKFSQKVSVEYGNHTTDSFSWDMDITGHTWYKNSQQVMKIDGNGLTVTGKIVGSEFICGNESSPTALIKSSGDYMIIGGDLALFDAEYTGQEVISFNTNEFEMRSASEIDITMQGDQVLYAESNYISQSDTYETRVSLGCDDDGNFKANKVAINGSTWVHVGVSSSSITIGNSNNGTTTNVVGDTAHLEGNIVCVGLDSSYSSNVIDIGHRSGSGYTGSYVFVNGYNISLYAHDTIALQGTVTVNGNPIPTSSGISISDVDSHYGTSVSGSYITWTLSAFNRLSFHSNSSGRTVTLNDIISALDTLVGHNIGN